MAAPPEWAWTVFNNPGAPPLFHQRLCHGVVASLATEEVVVTTPDGDTYVEDCRPTTGDVLVFRRAPGRWPPPAGIPRPQCYHFRAEPTAAQRLQWAGEAEAAARAYQAAEAAGRGVPVLAPGQSALAPMPPVGGGAVVPAVAPAAGPLAAPPGGGAAGAAPGAGAAAAPAGAAGAVAAAAGAVWVSSETRQGTIKRGDAVNSNGTEVLRGDRGLLELAPGSGVWIGIAAVPNAGLLEFKGKEADGDARLLAIGAAGQSRVRRLWREGVASLQQEQFPDFPVPGPRTTKWCCEFLNRKAGGPREHHKWWMSVQRVFPDMWGVQEHETIMQAVELMVGYDGLGVTNIAAAELLLRKAQLIEYSYSDAGPAGVGSGAPSGEGGNKKKGGAKGGSRAGVYDESQIFMGAHKEFGDILLDPQLLDYVAKEVERDAQVMKQVRKAREERILARKADG